MNDRVRSLLQRKPYSYKVSKEKTYSTFFSEKTYLECEIFLDGEYLAKISNIHSEIFMKDFINFLNGAYIEGVSSTVALLYDELKTK